MLTPDKVIVYTGKDKLFSSLKFSTLEKGGRMDFIINSDIPSDCVGEALLFIFLHPDNIFVRIDHFIDFS